MWGSGLHDVRGGPGLHNLILDTAIPGNHVQYTACVSIFFSSYCSQLILHVCAIECPRTPLPV